MQLMQLRLKTYRRSQAIMEIGNNNNNQGNWNRNYANTNGNGSWSNNRGGYGSGRGAYMGQNL